MSARHKLRFAALLLLCSAAILPTSSTQAQEEQPGDACAAGEDGWYKRSSLTTATDGGSMMICDGTSWIGFLTYRDAGNVGMGTTAPDASALLEMSSTSQGFLVPRMSDPNADIAAPAEGLIAYDLVDNELQFYDGTSWVAAGGGGGGGLWTDNTTHITRENLHVLDAGLAAGSTTAGLDGDGTYSFYDPDKGALRGGEIAGGGTEWQDANIGSHSFAWGLNTEASGLRSASIGHYTTASGDYSFAAGFTGIASGASSVSVGQTNTASGSYTVALGVLNEATNYNAIAIGAFNDATGGSTSIAIGDRNVASGSGSIAIGDDNTSSADTAIGIGEDNTSSADHAVAIGDENTAGGTGSFAAGKLNTANGYYSTALGHEVRAGTGVGQTNQSGSNVGNWSMAFGVGNASTATFPQVTGDESAGFFLGNQQSSDVTGAEIFAILGEALVVTDNGAGTTVAAPASAVAQFDSSDKGFLPPRMSDPNADITTPAEGLVAYDLVDSELQFFDGTSWVAAGGGGGAINDLSDGVTDYVTDFNLFMGDNAGASIAVGGQYNLAIGQNSGDAITTGDYNIAIGYNSGTNIDTEGSTIAIGIDALGGSSVSNGLAIGRSAKEAFDGIRNTAVGNYALRYGNGDENVALGQGALSGAVAGPKVRNVGLGRSAGSAISTGDNNIFLGYQAGDATTTGSSNIIIGYDVDASSATVSDELNIGGTIFADMANGHVGIGVADATVPDVELDIVGDIEYTGTISDMSDRRLKTDITNLPAGQLAKITALQGVTFKMKDNEDAEVETGFIAQDVQEIYPDLIYERSEGMLSMNYTGLIAPLVEAIKEQQATIEKLEARIDKLEAEKATFTP